MMFQITGDIGVPLCASLDIVLRLLETLPSFPANLMYQSNSPIICRFMPEAYAQPWLGLHSLDLAHALPLDSRRKAEDVLKEAILCSTGGSVAATGRTDPSASTSTAPTQIERDTKALSLEGLPSTSSSVVCSPSKRRCAKSPSPHCSWSSSSSGESSASECGSRGSHLSSSSSSRLGFRIWQWRWVPWWVPSWIQSQRRQGIGPLTNSIWWKCQSPLWRWGQWRRGWCLGLCQWGRCISRKYVPAWHLHHRRWGYSQMQSVNLPVKVTPTSQRGKTNSSVKGWWAYKSGTAWWMTMLMVGREGPRTLTPWGPHFLHEGTWGISAPTLHDMNPLGLCHFYPVDPVSMSMLTPPKSPATGRTSQGSPAPRENAAPAIYHRCVPRWPCYSIGAFAGAAYAERTCLYSNLPFWWNQGRAQATRVMLPILHVYCPEWSGIPQPHCQCMHYRANFAVWDLPQCRNRCLVNRWRSTLMSALGWPFFPRQHPRKVRAWWTFTQEECPWVQTSRKQQERPSFQEIATSRHGTSQEDSQAGR